MWSSLVIPALALIALLYIPGALVSLSLGLPHIVALACSPLFSTLGMVVSGILLSLTGVPGSAVRLFVGTFVLCLIAAVVARLIISRLTHETLALHVSAREAAVFQKYRGKTLSLVLCLALYLFVAALITVYFFYRGFESPDSFVQIYDNAFHLSTIRSIVNSGNYSTLSTGAYLEAGAAAIDPTPGNNGFYPAAWHILAAAISGGFDLSIPAAVHTTNFVFLAVALPVGVFALLAAISGRNITYLLGASFLPLAFIAFPWAFLYWGPLYSNLSAFSLVPAICALFIELVAAHMGFIRRVAGFLSFVVCMAALVFYQPNAVFTTGVFLAPYCVSQILRMDCAHICSRLHLSERLTRALLALAFVLFVVLMWAFFLQAGFMQGVVNFRWDPFTGFLDALQRAATLAFTSRSQPLLAVLVVLGILYTAYERRHLWLTVAYIFSIIAYIIDASTTGLIRNVVTGFWYTDRYRVAAMAAIFAIPLAAFGIRLIVSLAENAFYAVSNSMMGGGATPKRIQPVAVPAMIGILCAALNFWPNSLSGQGAGDPGALPPFGDVRSTLRYMYSLEQNAGNRLTVKELAFVEEAKGLIPDGAVVLNQQYDGSVFAYPLTGINLVYRSYSEACSRNEDEDSILLRTSLNEYTTNDEVRKTVENLNIEYVLVLDQGDNGEEGSSAFYHEDMWGGIQSITDETPGFEVVLARDDMRLYKIVRCS